MKTFTFIVVNRFGSRGILTLNELTQKLAFREAKRRARKLNLTLVL